jgi:hypothetical protein
MKTTEEIAKRLVELSRNGLFEEAQNELYADNLFSHEPPAVGNFKKAEIINKGRVFRSTLKELHGLVISDPIVCGNSFAITFDLDATFTSGPAKLQEVCAFKVLEGKIVAEYYVY